MHYTSIENIHKVIDPLFLDDLKKEFKEIQAVTVRRTKEKRLDEFQNKLASLTFLDPACGSGNFLTETYLSLRRLENEVIRERVGGQITLGEVHNPIKVSIQQFYGIEINDFAVTVAKTALWIAESQMLEETKNIVYGFNDDFLPLKTYVNITEGNALRIDWNEVVPVERLSYIMGNPPFVGYSYQSESQKKDIENVYVDENGKSTSTAGKIDYVAAWYFKAAKMMEGSEVRTAFVSTNSITQGEQVAYVWAELYKQFDIHIDFAHRTFVWGSEAKLKAAVHCVIIGFSTSMSKGKCRLYDNGALEETVQISPYLIDAPITFINSRTNPLCNVPKITNGNKPVDGGYLFLSPDEKDELIQNEPESKKFVRRVYGAEEFINSKERYCLWLRDISPKELNKLPMIKKRVQQVREFRLKSTKAVTVKSADSPTLFQQIRQPDEPYIIVPRVSSENLKSDMNVLELACGTGQLSFPLSDCTNSWTATDFSENMIKQAKRRGTTEKLSFCVADATALSYENENFDCVVISNALHIMPEPEKAMQEIRRVLKKDGILYAPTFLWAEKKSSGLRKRLMSITGFKAYKEWNKENFCEFITDYGFTVVKVNLVDGGLAPVGVLIAKKTNY